MTTERKVELVASAQETFTLAPAPAADDLDWLERVVVERVDYYNRSRRHSSPGYQTPLATLRQMRLDCQGTGKCLWTA